MLARGAGRRRFVAVAVPWPATPAPEQGSPRRWRPALRIGPVDAVLAGLLVLFFLLLAARFVAAPLDRFDEGLTVTAGLMAAAGRVPYRDFWTTYGPLDAYLLAAAFKVFGAQVLVERGLAIAVAGAFAIVSYALAGVAGLRRPVRFLVAGLLTMVPLSVGFLVSSFTADLFALMAVLFFLRSLRRPSWWWAAAAGTFTAVAAFGRLELGAAVGFGLTLGYLAAAIGSHRPRGAVFAYLAGAIAAGTALWIPVIAAAGPALVAYDLVIYAATLYPIGRGVPIGQGDGGLAIALFAVAFVAIWTWALVHIFRRRTDGVDRAALTGLLVPAVLVFAWVQVRADAGHALGAWPLTAALLAFVLGRGTRAPGRRADPAALCAVLLLDVLLLGLTARDLGSPMAAAAVPRAAVVGERAWIPAPVLATVVRAIEDQVPPEGTLFVGVKRNDEVVFNDTMLYFLAGRLPGTVYYEAVPALTNSAEVERRIICQLGRSQTTLVVLGPNGQGDSGNASSRPGSPLLDLWIAEHAVEAREVGPYTIMRLRAGPLSADCAG